MQSSARPSSTAEAEIQAVPPWVQSARDDAVSYSAAGQAGTQNYVVFADVESDVPSGPPPS